MRLPATALLAVIALASPALAGELHVSLDLSPDQVAIESFDGHDAVTIPGGVISTGEGLPGLPGIPLSYLLPQGTSLTAVEVVSSETVTLPGSYDLAPANYIPVSDPATALTASGPVWTADEPFPAEPVTAVHTGSKTGFRVGGFTLMPLSYRPLSGRLSMMTSVDLVLRYEADPEAPVLTLTDAQVAMAESGLENIVRNPEMLGEWAPALRDGGTDWSHWVVIADPDFETMLQPLVDHRQTTVGSAEFVSTDWIYSNYTGYDGAEKIRNYLIDGYENHGLIYALIVGDYGETTRISMLNVSGNTLASVTDLYYSDLDGTWDLDGDRRYGENSDGIDYYSDIYVGRFSTDVSSRLQTMIDRTIDYETAPTPGSWQTTVLLPAAGLWPQYGYWGSFVCDSIDKRIPASWLVYKLYENSSGHPNNQIAYLNSGVSWCEPTGHGYESGVFWYNYAPTDIISNANYTQLTNIDKLPVMSSIACLAGKISNIACIAERLMFWPTGGAVAVMFNSDNGWGTPPYMGPSEHLEVHMADQFWVYDQMEIGPMHSFAKDAFRAAGGMTFQNWVLQEHNLLGDPALLHVAGQTGIDEGTQPSPAGPVLSSPMPNPTGGACTLAYDLPSSGSFEVTVFDLSGRTVRTIHDGHLDAGIGTLGFDGRDGSGAPLPTGCYSVVMSGQAGTATTRMLVVR